MAGVAAIGVSKSYGARVALNDVTLSVRDGSFVAVMGPSGSGKSTLLHLLGGLDTPTAGTVSIGESVLSAMDERARTILRRRAVGIVFQSFNLVPVLTAEENVALPLIIDGRPAKESASTAREALDSVGMAGRENDLPSQLSGGEQQRVAIARAIVHGPSLLLADEPTGNLDSATGAAVLDVLRKRQQGTGSMMVVVTHDPGVAAGADEVIHLRDGEISGHLELVAVAGAPARLHSVGTWLASPDHADSSPTSRAQG